MLNDAGTDLEGSVASYLPMSSTPPMNEIFTKPDGLYHLLLSTTVQTLTLSLCISSIPLIVCRPTPNERFDSLSPLMTSLDSMNDENTSFDDDFFTLKPPTVHPIRRRRSSHIKRWIEQTNPLITSKPPILELPDATEPQLTVTSPSTQTTYPELSRLSLHLETSEGVFLQSSDFVEGHDTPESEQQSSPINQDASEVRVFFFQISTFPKSDHAPQHNSPPPSPTPVGRQSPNIVLHAPSLRNFHLSFRSTSPSISITESPNQSHNPPRISLFRRTSRANATQHARTSSSPTLYVSPPPGVSHSQESSISGQRTRGSNWRWRPSVLGHFSSPSEPGVYVPNNGPRASTSSTTITFTSTTPSATTDLTDQMSFVSSVRSRAQTPLKRRSLPKTASPTPSVWSLPRPHQPPNISSGSNSTPALVQNNPRLLHKASTIRLPFSHKHKASEHDNTVPHIAYASSHRSKGSLPRVSFSSPGRNKKKKKLVISGIKAEETRRFEAAKRWCEVRVMKGRSKSSLLTSFCFI
jgi:hypothetical protein